MGKVRQATRKPLVAWSLTGAVLVVLAAALVLLGLNASRLNASRLDAGQIGLYGLLSVGVLAYAGAGGLIARRVPGNAIGWLLGLAGLSLTVAMLTEQYVLYGLATAPGAVPAAKVAGVLSAAAVALTVILLFVLVLLFPDGRLPSRRWRPVLWALAVVAAGLVAQQFQAGTMISGGITDALNGPGVSYPNPMGVLPQHGWFSGRNLRPRPRRRPARRGLGVRAAPRRESRTPPAAGLARLRRRADRRLGRAPRPG
jgi:hypothetical protein